MKRKPANTIKTAILVSALAAGMAWAQSPSIIQNTRDTMNGVSNRSAAASNAALEQAAPATTSTMHVQSAPMKISTGAGPMSAKHPRKPGTKRVAIVGTRPSAPVKAVEASKAPVAEAEPAKGGTEGVPAEAAENEQPVTPDSKTSANGRRDPFLSPVVSHAGGSGCSTGKKCLEIGAINLRGVVRSQNGFIAVVSNGLNKAYFLRENDPVFNGYVVKITGDSIVFQETLQDRLGKSFTREVVKKITTPAV
ncbi:MAG TPA: hypothetical protein VK828_07645 [Terriglobales bacterium]|jgi:hypothetical protein|nr:hypothetical protein [Terriglobales bacterium]